VASGVSLRRSGRNSSTRRLAAVAVVATVCYGVCTEFGQSLVPERYFSPGDTCANALGVVLVLPWYAVRPYVDVVPLRSWLGELSE
jgi:VanZ family protein